MRYLVDCLGHSAFIFKFYIAFDIILICLTGDCFINMLRLRDPFKSYEIVPSIRPQWIFTHPSMECGLICSCFRRQMGIGLQNIGLECGFI